MGNLKDNLVGAIVFRDDGVFEIDAKTGRETELVTDSEYLPQPTNDNIDCGEVNFQLPAQWDAKEQKRIRNEGNGQPYEPWY